jgi:hypothetical protein
MGGYGSGGHNRRKNYVGSTIRLDSFYFSQNIQRIIKAGKENYTCSITWGKENNAALAVHQDRLIISYIVTTGAKQENISDTFYFERVPNNYGGAERLYFLCLYCGNRARYIYLNIKRFMCRKCAKLNYISQQVTKDWQTASRRMENFIRDKFKITEKIIPREAVYYRPERPKGMHWQTYHRLYVKLLRLQDEYNYQFRLAAARICRCLPDFPK